MQTFELAMQGRGHLKNELPCQDKTAVKKRNGVTCIALADGAGSARLSHFGASTVVDTVSDFLCQHFEDFYQSGDVQKIKEQILDAVHIQLSLVAKEHACKVEELASTLLFVVCKEGRFIGGQLGDGCIVFLRDNKLQLAVRPDKGEFANTTYFITSSHAVSHLKLFKGDIGEIKGFFLMSDGTAESLYQRQSGTLAPFIYRILVDTYCKSEEYLQQETTAFFKKYILQKTLDDCSLVAMPLYKDFKDFFESMKEEEVPALFYKSKTKAPYLEEYISIVQASSSARDINELAIVTKLSIKILKRRLCRLARLGFKNFLAMKV